MTPLVPYLHALELAQAGQPDTALAEIDAFLKERPDYGRGWNDAGRILLALGQYDKAVRYFLRAVETAAAAEGLYRNLAQSYAAAGKPSCAMRWFERMRQEGQLDAAIVHQIADSFVQQGDAASAMETLCRGRDALPTAAELDGRIEALRPQRAKIAFFVGGDGATFLKDILPYLRRRYNVRLFDGKTAEDIAALMLWSDVSWFEWATNLAQIGTNLPKCCRTIIRLHRYEAYEPWPSHIRWENVDTLITVGNESVIKALNVQVGDIHKKTAIVRIPNGVALEAVPFAERRAGKNIAFVGNLRMVKNPLLLLHCMAALKQHDPQYRVFIAGAVQDILMQQTLEHSIAALGLKNNVIYDGYQKDIYRWLSDKHYVVSTSFIESQGMGILEAMAAGLKPVIFNFPGAAEIYPTHYLFNTPQEFCRRIMEPDFDSESYRQFVEVRYPLSGQLTQINALLAAYEKAPRPQQSAGGSVRLSGLSLSAV